jgi:hypothetical protein
MLTPVDRDELVQFYEDWAAKLFALFPPRRQS